MADGTDVQIEDRLALPLSKVGPALLELAESQWFDRKSNLINTRRLADTLIAFANAEGGFFVIGLADKQVQGISARKGKESDWRQSGIDYCEPAIKVVWREVKCITSSGKPDSLLVGHVQPSSHVHSTKSDDVLLRVGDENRKLTFSQRQELIYDKGQSQFDGTVTSGVSVTELDDRLLRDYAVAIHSSSRENALAARGLVTPKKHLTAAAVLLFGRNPQSVFPHALVRVVRYRGLTKETGSRQQIAEDVRCEGAIPRVLGQAQDAVARLQPMRRLLGADGKFTLQGLIPHDAWLEGLVNAVVHRSYSLGGDCIHIDIFDDRIEVESPGLFPGLIKTSDLPNVTRFARNPRIARVCADLRFGQELGEGIRRMYEEMRARGLAEPLYTETRSSVRLTLSSIVADGRALGQFKPGYLQIMDLLRRANSLSTGELVEALGVARPTALARLKALEELGYVEHVSKSRSDPRAFWRMRSE